MKPVNKKILKTSLILFTLLLLFWAGRAIYLTIWQTNQREKALDVFNDIIEEPHKSDSYGEKTPEATWAMYVEAIKKGDIELASKYVGVENRHTEKEFLEGELKRDNLREYMLQISSPLEKDPDRLDYKLADDGEKTGLAYIYQNTVYYIFKWKNKKTGKLEIFRAIFYLNPYTHVWKILK